MRSEALAPDRYSQAQHTVTECSFPIDDFCIVGDLVLPDDRLGHPIIVFVWGSGPAGRENVGRPSALVTSFIEAGFGVFIEDKPGTGSSTGTFAEGRLLHQRARILSAEIEHLRGLPDVAPSAVGVYGSSQASYVIGLALDAGTRIDFLMAVSCPTTDTVEQSAYLVEQQLLCAGHSSETASKARRCYVQRERASTYEAYLEAASFLDGNEVVRDELSWGGVVSQEDFVPRHPAWEEFHDPRQAFERLSVPLLALFGEKDTQVDPVQGIGTFSRLDAATANPMSKVLLIAEADHNMRRSETGCLREQRESYRSPGGAEYAPLFLETIRAWLRELGAHLRCAGETAMPSD